MAFSLSYTDPRNQDLLPITNDENMMRAFLTAMPLIKLFVYRERGKEKERGRQRERERGGKTRGRRDRERGRERQGGKRGKGRERQTDREVTTIDWFTLL